MKLNKIGISLCLTAMAGLIFNIGASACTPSADAKNGSAIRQKVQSPYAQQWKQVQYSYSAGTSQKQPKSSADKASDRKQQPKTPDFKAPYQKQSENPAFKGPYQKQQPKASSEQELAQVKAQREQINTLNKQVLSLKAQARKDILIICADLAKVASDPAVRESEDYKTIVSTLAKVKTELADAEKIDYCSKLASVKGHNDASSALSGVITQMKTKISDLTAVVNELGGLLPKADALVQKAGQPTTSQPVSQPATQPTDQQAAQKAWQQFLTQADAKKKTIDSNTQQLAAVNKSCQDAVNEIVATAAANRDVLSDQGSGMADIVVQLGTVKTSLAAQSNDKIAAALKAYAQDLKKQDYAAALDELDAIIGIQNDRISAVKSALSQLQSALSSLQNLVATAAASSQAA